MDSEKEINQFLDNICTKFGICLSPESVKQLTSKTEYVADDFIRDVFEQEGLNPDLHLTLFRQVKRHFTDKYGNELS